MNTLLKENIKEIYKKHKGHVDNLVNIAMIELPGIIKEEDKDRTLDSWEIKEMAKYLLIKLIKKYD